MKQILYDMSVSIRNRGIEVAVHISEGGNQASETVRTANSYIPPPVVEAQMVSQA